MIRDILPYFRPRTAYELSDANFPTCINPYLRHPFNSQLRQNLHFLPSIQHETSGGHLQCLRKLPSCMFVGLTILKNKETSKQLMRVEKLVWPSVHA